MVGRVLPAWLQDDVQYLESKEEADSMSSSYRAAIVHLGIVVLALPLLVGMAGSASAATQEEVAEYVRDAILGGSLDGVTLWMTATALDTTHVARDIDPSVPDLPFPYSSAWLVMIDDNPRAYWGHPCRWTFVNDNLAEHTIPMNRDFTPTVFSGFGAGPEVDFGCVDFTWMGAVPCPDLASLPMGSTLPKGDKSCLYAILISGGWKPKSNITAFSTDLTKMYNKLRGCGYPKANISVYYDNGGSLDLDGDETSDVTGKADQSSIRTKIKSLCTTLDTCSVLFIFVTNHGVHPTEHGANGILLWDFNGDGNWNDDEVYTPDELSDDTKDCNVCRLFMLMLQCYSGRFKGIAGDGNHANTAIYVAASPDEQAWSSGVGENYAEYLTAWDDNDPATTSMNDMHQHVVNSGTMTSTPDKAEGTPGIGNSSLCDCCEPSATERTSWGAIKSLHR
jgi:hypothetical protein